MTRDKAPPDPDQPDSLRRALLRRIGLAGTMAYVAPALTALGAARADDDDGGDDDGDDGDDGDDDDAAAGPDSPRGERGERGGRPGRTRQRARQRAAQPARRPRTPRQPEIVILLPFASPADFVQTVSAVGYRVISTAPGFAAGELLLRVALPAGRSTAEARSEITALVPGALVDENHLYTPDEFLCGAEGCASHAMIGWNGWPSALAPRIGMIDTGINADHAALRGQRLTTHQVPLADRDAAGRQHGTAVAAMLIGRTDQRVPGLLPLAELIAVEAFHDLDGADAADAFSLARAAEILIEAGVQVINLSFSGPENAVLRRVLAAAAEANIGLVAAAGNGGPGAKPAYPAAWPEVIAVTAVDSAGNAYRQANRGPYVTLAAPGVNVWTAASVSGGRLRSGTSFAAPFVTASLAVERLRAPEAPVQETVEKLIGCARDLGEAGFDEVFGHGLLSAPSMCVGDQGNYLTSGD